MADKKKSDDSRDVFEKALDDARDFAPLIPLATGAAGYGLTKRYMRRYFKSRGVNDADARRFAKSDPGPAAAAIFGGAAGVPLAAAAKKKKRK